MHWDGAAWSIIRSPRSADVNGVWGSAHDDVWAVDSAGAFLHFDGVRWREWPALNAGPLDSVWGRNAADVIAAGEGQRVHFDGKEWSLLPPHLHDKPHYNIAFGNSERVWLGGYVPWSAYKAGGAHSEPGRWDGHTLSDDLEPVYAQLPTLNLNNSAITAGWGTADEDLWIALPQILHWNGREWALFPIQGYEPQIDALWGTESDLWALAKPAQILRRAR